MNKVKQFISFIVTTSDDEELIENFLNELSRFASGNLTDYEILVIDNASKDNTGIKLIDICERKQIANLLYMRLAYKVPADQASWAGVENSIGDNVILLDAREDSLECLDQVLERIDNGIDLIYVENKQVRKNSLLYNISSHIFHSIYKLIYGVGIKDDSSSFKAISRTLINLVSRNNSKYKLSNLSMFSGFSFQKISYNSDANFRKKSFIENIDKGMSLLFATSKLPLRIVSVVCLLIASLNIVYSAYIVLTYLFSENVAEGWTTLSLQSSGMFFLISLVLLSLCEFISNSVSQDSLLNNYIISKEKISEKFTLKEKLNIEDDT